MSVTTVILAVFLPVVCIVVANVLMRLFDVKDATPEQTLSEVEKLLSQVICVNRLDTRGTQLVLSQGKEMRMMQLLPYESVYRYLACAYTFSGMQEPAFSGEDS